MNCLKYIKLDLMQNLSETLIVDKGSSYLIISFLDANRNAFLKINKIKREIEFQRNKKSKYEIEKMCSKQIKVIYLMKKQYYCYLKTVESLFSVDVVGYHLFYINYKEVRIAEISRSYTSNCIFDIFTEYLTESNCVKEILFSHQIKSADFLINIKRFLQLLCVGKAQIKYHY